MTDRSRNWWSVAALILLVTLAAGSSDSSSSGSSTSSTEAVYNSPWDGSVRQVERYLKHNLKDPDSYQSIEWSPVVKTGTGFVVRHKYRAKNSFGGYVIEEKMFALDSAGNVIDGQ